jgi:hypothetical protein
VNNSELMLRAVTNGLDDDATISAALDAIREESGCTLLAAVLELARVWHSCRAARDITEATAHLAEGSELKAELEQNIAAECPDVRPGTYLSFAVCEGELWPRSVDNSLFADGVWVRMAHITVGALWVKREASRIMVERERKARRPRTRRAR